MYWIAAFNFWQAWCGGVDAQDLNGNNQTVAEMVNQNSISFTKHIYIKMDPDWVRPNSKFSLIIFWCSDLDRGNLFRLLRSYDNYNQLSETYKTVPHSKPIPKSAEVISAFIVRKRATIDSMQNGPNSATSKSRRPCHDARRVLLP